MELKDIRQNVFRYLAQLNSSAKLDDCIALIIVEILGYINKKNADNYKSWADICFRIKNYNTLNKTGLLEKIKTEILQDFTSEIKRELLETKAIYSFDNIDEAIENLLEKIQSNIFDKALKFRTENTHPVDNYEDFKRIISGDGGFVLAHWDGTAETEAKIKEETKATIRCIPFDSDIEPGKCIYSGKPSEKRVIFAKSY